MRNAILQMPERRTAIEQRRVLRASTRQLERADIYVAAVAHMDLGDAAVERLVRVVRADLEGLRRHLGDQRERLGR